MDLKSRIAKNTREYDMMMIMMTDEIKFQTGYFKDLCRYMQKCCQ
jgi:hypothetical protein